MAQDYSEYLAANVLNEQQYVTYRLLSRALKVHSNLAKQMLYEFHRKQNAKKPGSVHATYLLTGIRRVEVPQRANGVHSQDGEDTVMQSSPVMPSSSVPAPDETMEEAKLVRSIVLVKEEDLEEVKNTFDTVSSIHIYSLEANTLKDLQVLTECNRKIGVDFASEDPLETWKQYGTIQNPNVKRRARGKAPPPPPPVAKNNEVKTKAAAISTTKKEAAEIKPDSKASSANATPEPEKKGSTKPAAAKRQNSDIFKSFAKAKAQPKKTDSLGSKEASPTVAEPPAVAGEDVPMTGFSSDEGEDEAEEPQEEVKEPTGKSKREREAELKAMMDAEDDDMEDAEAATPAAENSGAETPVEKAEAPKEEAPKEEEPKETVTVENGRRRGRRRVMKKKTVKDEEGYLVTREEAVWESFSEDEPAPKKAKPTPAASANKPAAKKGGKPGQGNIMSFFGKK